MTYPSTQIIVPQTDDRPLLYIKLCPGKVARTRVLIKDQVLADYDKDGVLVGVEIIA